MFRRDLIDQCIEQLPYNTLYRIVRYLLCPDAPLSWQASCRINEVVELCSPLIRKHYIRFKEDASRTMYLLPVEVSMFATTNFKVFLCPPIGIKRVNLELPSDNGRIQRTMEELIPNRMQHVSEIGLLQFSGNMTLLTDTTTNELLPFYSQRVKYIGTCGKFNQRDFEIISKLPLKYCKINFKQTPIDRENFKYLNHVPSFSIPVKRSDLSELFFNMKNLKKLAIYVPDPYEKIVTSNTANSAIVIEEDTPENTTNIDELSISFKDYMEVELAKEVQIAGLKRQQITFYYSSKYIFPKFNWISVPNTELIISTILTSAYTNGPTLDMSHGGILAEAPIYKLQITSDVRLKPNFYSFLSKTTTIKDISLIVTAASQIEYLLSGNTSFETVSVKCCIPSFQMHNLMNIVKKALNNCPTVTTLEIHSSGELPSQRVIGNCTVYVLIDRPSQVAYAVRAPIIRRTARVSTGGVAPRKPIYKKEDSSSEGEE
jgi:hypothetical protein